MDSVIAANLYNIDHATIAAWVEGGRIQGTRSIAALGPPRWEIDINQLQELLASEKPAPPPDPHAGKVQVGYWWIDTPAQSLAALDIPTARAFVNGLAEYLRTDQNLTCFAMDYLRAWGLRLEVGEEWPDRYKQKEKAQ
jgi:hypothetical protein